MLFVVRHGRTAANASGLLLGRLDPDLDELGVRQATAAAAALGSVDRVVSSPLLRTRHTAEAFGREVEVDDRWIEMDYGEFDGQPEPGGNGVTTWTGHRRAASRTGPSVSGSGPPWMTCSRPRGHLTSWW